MSTTRVNLQAGIRKLISMPDTSQITANDLNTWISEYYRNHFPREVDVPELRGFFSQSTSATDAEKYSVSADVLELNKPFMVNGSKVDFTLNESDFFEKFPKTDGGDAHTITDPSLAIGSSDKAAVANSAFAYEIAGYSYSKAAAETALSGDTIPQSKYGAFRLEIDDDGTISIVEADDNATGYKTPALAIEDLENESSDNACMGFVTVINTSAAFVPGTTQLDASGVTATYTDGFHSTRNKPTDLLWFAGYLYARPKPDDIYLIEAGQVLKPTDLDDDDEELPDDGWKLTIEYGTAILILKHYKKKSEADDLVEMYRYLKNGLNRKKLSAIKNAHAKRSF